MAKVTVHCATLITDIYNLLTDYAANVPLFIS